MEEYQTTDPVLSDCAKELIRYIIGTDQTETVTVTDILKKQNMVVINENKYIFIQDDKLYQNWNLSKLKNLRKESLLKKGIDEKNIYCVCYSPLGKPCYESDVLYINRRQFLQICNSYQSSNQIYNSYLEYLTYIDSEMNSLKERFKNIIL